MEFTANQIAEVLDGTVEGVESQTVTNLSKIEEGEPNTLSFLANAKYEEYIYSTKASVVIVNKDFKPQKALPKTCTLIKVDNAYECFAKLLEMYDSYKNNKTGISKRASVSDSAKIGKDVYIADFVVVSDNVEIGDNTKIFASTIINDNVKIGSDCKIYSGVNIYDSCLIGDECTLHSGVILGGDGFGFAPNSENNYKKVPQIGNVILEDHVEIGSNSTIDRATLGSTIIRKGVKLDNLIQIAHNVEIGENTVIAAQTGVAGSTKIGKNCMIGGQVGIVGHLTIADGVKIAAQSGIGHSIKKEGEIMQGSPAFSIMDYKKSYVLFKNLPHLKQKIDKLSE